MRGEVMELFLAMLISECVRTTVPDSSFETYSECIADVSEYTGQGTEWIEANDTDYRSCSKLSGQLIESYCILK